MNFLYGSVPQLHTLYRLVTVHQNYHIRMIIVHVYPKTSLAAKSDSVRYYVAQKGMTCVDWVLVEVKFMSGVSVQWTR